MATPAALPSATALSFDTTQGGLSPTPQAVFEAPLASLENETQATVATPAASPPSACVAVDDAVAGPVMTPKLPLYRLRTSASFVDSTSSGTWPAANKESETKKRGRPKGSLTKGLNYDEASRATQHRRWKKSGGAALLQSIGASTAAGVYILILASVITLLLVRTKRL